MTTPTKHAKSRRARALWRAGNGRKLPYKQTATGRVRVLRWVQSVDQANGGQLLQTADLRQNLAGLPNAQRRGVNSTTETIGNATGKTGWRKTFPKKWTPPAQPCGAWGRRMNPPPETVMQCALDAYGIDHQTDKCLEELGELATALIQYRQGRIELDTLRSEIADVLITVGQLRLHHGATAVDQQVAVKLSRLQRLVADQVQAKVQATAKPEPKPVRPALCWSKWQDGYLLLDGTNWRGYVGHLNGRWAADTGTNDRQWFDDSASAMREIERRNGLDEVPLWT